MAKKGDTLTDFITAGFYNDVVKKLRLNLGARGKGQVDQNQFVTVYNHEAVFKKPWTAVSLGDPKVTYAAAIDDRHSEIGFTTKALDNNDPHNIAILQEPLPPEIGASAQALIVGSSWLRMPYSTTDLFFPTVDPPYFVKIGSSDTLEYSTYGRIEVLRDFDITGGNWLAFAVIGKTVPNSIEPSSLIIYPPLLQVTFTSASHDWTAGDSARGFTADQVSPITYSSPVAIGEYPEGLTLPSITLENTNNLNWISGDKAIVRKVDFDTYRVIKVLRAKALAFRFALTADAPTGLAQTITSFSVICPVGSESGPPPTSPTLKDTYSLTLNAKNGHKGIAEYDWNHDWYVVTECEHTCLRFIGTLYSTLSGTAATIEVVPVTPLNGKALPAYSNSLTVYNTYSWESGTTGHKILCEWNPIDGRWETNQMRCPN